MLWAAILLPSLALDGALRRRPPVDRPFALVHGPAQQRRLLAVNALAHVAGLAPGQRLAEAEAICHELATAALDPRQPERDLALIAAWAYGYSSEVALDPPRTVTLEIGKSLRLFGPWATLEARLRGELAALGFHARIALAPNPHAARVLAGVRDGALAVDATTLMHKLATIPVTRAGLPAAAAQALPDMGIRRLGQALELPRAALQRRFGAECVLALDRLLGNRPHGLAIHRPPDRFDAYLELPAETANHTTLLFPLRRMLADLAAFVAARDGGVQQFLIRFTHEDAAPTELRVGLLAPARKAATLFEVVRLRLERTRLPAPVRDIEVRAAELPAFTPAGRDLFDARPQAAEAWTTLRERLRAREGMDAVHGIRVDPDPRPERASASAADDAAPTGAAPALPPRPAWLLPRPIPLRGPAPRILAGPERLETGWWDGGDVRRDYYVLELATGQRAWAFCAPAERGPFMLHGWFA
jgi:protein ImuB